jgi:drug/metabolite transporter (DMT)-like permease
VPNVSRARLDIWAIAIMVVLCSFWGLNQVAIKTANQGISPVFQAGLRSLGSAVLLWAWMSYRGTPLFQRDGSLRVGILLGLLFAVEFIFLFWSLQFAGASRTVLFLYTAPFFVALGAHVFVPTERLTGLRTIGLIAAFAGVVIAFGDALRFPSGRELFGDFLAFLAAIFWASTTVLVKASRLAKLDPGKTLFYQLAVSIFVLFAVSASVGEPGIVAPTPAVVGWLIYQIVVISFFSYLTWFWLMTRYPASTLATFTLLTPIFGLAAGGVLLAEPITAALVLAMLLVAIGIYLVNRVRPAALVVPGALSAGD